MLNKTYNFTQSLSFVREANKSFSPQINFFEISKSDVDTGAQSVIEFTFNSKWS
jgi:hypothetical protein